MSFISVKDHHEKLIVEGRARTEAGGLIKWLLQFFRQDQGNRQKEGKLLLIFL